MHIVYTLADSPSARVSRVCGMPVYSEVFGGYAENAGVVVIPQFARTVREVVRQMNAGNEVYTVLLRSAYECVARAG